tara:strand:- start:28 stop:447 length:420 start_codon:yes stop_codon:yes gene_type:complete
MSLYKNGICNKCPLCRQEEWKKLSLYNYINKKKIIPKNNISIIITQSYENNNTRNTTKNYLSFCCIKFCKIFNIIILIYLSGLFTILSLVGKEIEFSSFFWVPFIIGFIEFFILLVCCFGCCGIKKGLDDILCINSQTI